MHDKCRALDKLANIMGMNRGIDEQTRSIIYVEAAGTSGWHGSPDPDIEGPN